MSAPTPPAPTGRSTRLRAIAIGATLVLLCVVLILVSPAGNRGDNRLTTAEYGPRNARLAFDLASRFGFRAEALPTPLSVQLDSSVSYVVADGDIPMPAADRRAVLDAVRRGAGLLVMHGSTEPALFDSLGVTSLAGVGTLDTVPSAQCTQTVPELRRIGLVSMLRTVTPIVGADSQPVARAPRDTVHFATVRVRTTLAEARGEPIVPPDTASRAYKDSVNDADPDADATDSSVTVRRPAMLGFPFGRGRVVVLGDADMLRTDELRECIYGHAPRYLSALTYLTTGRSRTLRFAEFYQTARGDGAGTVAWEFLTTHPLGRALGMLGVAGVVWILARGRRTLAPVDLAREERRSALEHVDALAMAWRAVRGTRTVAQQLAHGLRRRHASGRWRTLPDDEFLAALAQRHPAIADDADQLARALAAPIAPDDLPDLRAAVARIDAACLTP